MTQPMLHRWFRPRVDRKFFYRQDLAAVSYLVRTPFTKMTVAEREEVARDWRWLLLRRNPELRSIPP